MASEVAPTAPEGTIPGCPGAAAAMTASPMGISRSAPPFPWLAAAAAAAAVAEIAVDTGWNPVVLGMPGVPRTAASAY